MTQAFNLALLANKVNTSGQLDASTGLYNVPVPSGSVFLLYQASAPTGWTQVTTLNDYALRIVSSTGGTTGGTTAFSTVFTNQTPAFSGSIGTLAISATTLSTAQLASHFHTTVPSVFNDGTGTFGGGAGCPSFSLSTVATNSQGGGGSHTHSISGTPSGTVGSVTLNVRYANIILCSKN